MRGALSRRLGRIWYADRRPPGPLRLLERVYRSAIRHRLGRPAQRPPCPVVVVGNLVAGGSGKTPVVAAVARALTDAGFRVAIIARGYASRAGRGPLLVEDGASAEAVGDEAVELAQVTGLEVRVGSARRAVLAAAVAAGAEVVVSDDGLQHAQLPRSFEVCVVDGRRGFGNGHLLPAGPLRQPPARLSTVDLVLIKRPPDGQLRDDLPDGAGFDLSPGELVPADPSSRTAPPRPGDAIDAVAGIADPEAFFAGLRALGFRVRRYPLADHQPVDAGFLARLRGPVVMTAKDRARLGARVRGDAFVLPVRAALPDSVLRRIVAHVREFRP